MAEEGAAHLLIAKLDDIMWLYNIRANDVDCNPVALSYTYISKDKAILFIQTEALTEEAKQHFEKNGVTCEEYDTIQFRCHTQLIHWNFPCIFFYPKKKFCQNSTILDITISNVFQLNRIFNCFQLFCSNG